MKRRSARTKAPSPGAGRGARGSARAGVRGGPQRVARHDLLEERARARIAGVGGHPEVAHVALAEAKQAAFAQDRRGQSVAARDELLDVDRLASLDARDEPEVRGGEQADVVGILPVDALEALGDDQANACQLLGGRAVLPGGSLCRIAGLPP